MASRVVHCTNVMQSLLASALTVEQSPLLADSMGNVVRLLASDSHMFGCQQEWAASATEWKSYEQLRSTFLKRIQRLLQNSDYDTVWGALCVFGIMVKTIPMESLRPEWEKLSRRLLAILRDSPESEPALCASSLAVSNWIQRCSAVPSFSRETGPLAQKACGLLLGRLKSLERFDTIRTLLRSVLVIVDASLSSVKSHMANISTATFDALANLIVGGSDTVDASIQRIGCLLLERVVPPKSLVPYALQELKILLQFLNLSGAKISLADAASESQLPSLSQLLRTSWEAEDAQMVDDILCAAERSQLFVEKQRIRFRQTVNSILLFADILRCALTRFGLRGCAPVAVDVPSILSAIETLVELRSAAGDGKEDKAVKDRVVKIIDLNMVQRQAVDSIASQSVSHMMRPARESLVSAGLSLVCALSEALQQQAGPVFVQLTRVVRNGFRMHAAGFQLSTASLSTPVYSEQVLTSLFAAMKSMLNVHGLAAYLAMLNPHLDVVGAQLVAEDWAREDELVLPCLLHLLRSSASASATLFNETAALLELLSQRCATVIPLHSRRAIMETVYDLLQSTVANHQVYDSSAQKVAHVSQLMTVMTRMCTAQSSAHVGSHAVPSCIRILQHVARSPIAPLRLCALQCLTDLNPLCNAHALPLYVPLKTPESVQEPYDRRPLGIVEGRMQAPELAATGGSSKRARTLEAETEGDAQKQKKVRETKEPSESQAASQPVQPEESTAPVVNSQDAVPTETPVAAVSPVSNGNDAPITTDIVHEAEEEAASEPEGVSTATALEPSLSLGTTDGPQTQESEPVTSTTEAQNDGAGAGDSDVSLVDSEDDMNVDDWSSLASDDDDE